MKPHVRRVCLFSASLICVVACKKTRPLTYHRLGLPGFSIQAPIQLTYQADLNATYRTGKVQWKDRTHHILVAWRRGLPLTSDDVPALIKAVGQLAPASAGQFVAESGDYTASGLVGFQVTLKNPRYRIQFFEAPCGKRVVTITAAAPTAQMPALWHNLTTAITCLPQAEQESTLDTEAPITPDVPELLAGWERVATNSTYVISNDDRVIVVQPFDKFEGLTTAVAQPLIQALGAQIGGTWVAGRTEAKSGPFGRRELMFGSMTLDEAELHAVVSMFRCDGRSTGLLLLVMGDTATSTQAGLAELSTKIRCALPGDPPLRLAPSESSDLAPAQK